MSDLLIRGLEMPQHGFMTITISANGRVIGDDSDERRTHKSPIGRAVPIPPHGRLGDLDALIDKVIAKYLNFERNGKLVFAAAEIKQDICDLISDAPTIIPASE